MNATAEKTNSGKHEEFWFALRVVVLFALAVGGFLLLVSLRGRGSSTALYKAKLPDGTFLVVRAVTTGKFHTMEIPYSFDTQISRWEKSYTQSQSTSANRMLIWLTQETARGEMLSLDWFRNGVLILPDGTQVHPNSYRLQQNQAYNSSSSSAGSDGFNNAKPYPTGSTMLASLVYCELPLVRPVPGSSLKLDVYDGNKTVVSQLIIPFPALPIDARENWQPDPLPATRTDQDLKVTLTAIKYTANRDGGINVQPQLEILRDGQPTDRNHWSVGYDLIDPLGNASNTWKCELSTQEPAWKLAATLYQTKDGDLRPEEHLKLPLRTVPAPKNFLPLSERHSVNGASVSLIGLVGRGPVIFTPDPMTHVTTGSYQPGQTGFGLSSSGSPGRTEIDFSSGHPFLITANLGTPQENLQVVIRDQSGTDLMHNGTMGANDMTFWNFDTKPSTAQIEIELIVQKTRRVEFLIAPPKPGEIVSE
ncbi:MAG: hypothetical protein JSS49_03200 [Planctomycetes bacterium]|nr:hypothetical protein [Planctomycetota bacterium]